MTDKEISILLHELIDAHVSLSLANKTLAHDWLQKRAAVYIGVKELG
jgi:hypothetical protein